MIQARLLKNYKQTAVLAFGLLGLGLVAGLVLPAAKVSAADTTPNAIMYGGSGSASSFIQKVQANTDPAGHHDLQAIYAHYNLVPANYSKFVASARPGQAYSDGRIVVDGQVVATGSMSIGRLQSYQGSGAFSVAIGGHTYYGNTNDKNFHSSPLAVMVMFDSKGAPLFSVLTDCGNPIWGHGVTPSYSCNALQKTAVAGKANTYRFTTSASAANNASIVKVVYNFGDGSAPVEQANPATPVEHTFTKTSKVTVTVYVHLPGNQTVAVPASAPCSTVITVLQPYYACVQLAPSVLDKTTHSYQFVATAKFGNGATFTSGDFNFGDGQTVAAVKPNGTTVTAQHKYAAAGTYSITATLHFNVNGVDKSVNCTAKVTPTTVTPECKPGVPEGSAECQPPVCQYNSSLPPESPDCKPAELANTGPGSAIAIFVAVAAAGAISYWYLQKRRAAMATAGGAHFAADHQGVDHNDELIHHLSQSKPHQVHKTDDGVIVGTHNAHHNRPNRFRPGSHTKKHK